MLALFFVVIFFTVSIFGTNIITLTSNVESEKNLNQPIDTTRSRAQTHTVFAEDFTAEWCQYCPAASETLRQLSNSGGYQFYFVCMITQDENQTVISDDAQNRADEMSVSSYPTVEFDSGYYEETGAPQDENGYVQAIEACGDRNVADIDIKLTSEYLGTAKLDIDVEIVNNDDSTYSGRLRVYIAEIDSRYYDYDGNPYPNGFLDFAINRDIDVSSGSTISESATWDGAAVVDGLGDDYGDIDPNNIIVIAAMFNGESTPFRERDLQHSSKVPNLFLVDEADAVYLSGESVIDEDPPVVNILSPTEDEVLPGADEEQSDSVKIIAEISDDASIKSKEFEIDNNGIWMRMYPLVPYDDQYFVFWNLDSTDTQDGEHIITVRGIDVNDNIGQDSITVIVERDNEHPKIVFNDLENDQEVKETFSFYVQVTDDKAVSRVSYNIDDGSWRDMEAEGYNQYTAELDTTKLSEGRHTLTIEAEDTSGKIITESINIKVKNDVSEGSPESATPGFEGIFLIISAAILVIYFSRYSKRLIQY